MIWSMLLSFFFVKKTTKTDFRDVLKEIMEHHYFKTYYNDRSHHYDRLMAVHASLCAHRTRLMNKWLIQHYSRCVQEMCEYIVNRKNHRQVLNKCILSEEFYIRSSEKTSHHFMRFCVLPPLTMLGSSSSWRHEHHHACLQELTEMWSYRQSRRMFFKTHVLIPLMDRIRPKIFVTNFFRQNILPSMIHRVQSMSVQKQQLHHMLFFKENCVPLIPAAAASRNKKREHDIFVNHIHRVMISSIIMTYIIIYSWMCIINGFAKMRIRIKIIKKESRRLKKIKSSPPQKYYTNIKKQCQKRKYNYR